MQQILLIIIIIGALILPCAASSLVPEEEEDLTTVLARIKESIVLAEITADTPAYDGYGADRKVTGQFDRGEIVEIIRDYSFIWYQVRGEQAEGWIPRKTLAIPEDPETNREWLPIADLEAYVNSQDFESRTDHLVWVDIDRQLTHVFTGSQGNWKLKHTMPSSTGKNVSPTLRGLHEVSDRGDWFYTERLARGGRYWVKFSGPYLFHGLPMDKQGNIMDYTLLERGSSGCIRLSMEDSKWFHSFIKRGTTVFVN